MLNQLKKQIVKKDHSQYLASRKWAKKLSNNGTTNEPDEDLVTMQHLIILSSNKLKKHVEKFRVL